MDRERPMVLRRNEGNKCQNRNSILSFYMDQRKCQAYALEKQGKEKKIIDVFMKLRRGRQLLQAHL